MITSHLCVATMLYVVLMWTVWRVPNVIDMWLFAPASISFGLTMIILSIEITRYEE